VVYGSRVVDKHIGNKLPNPPLGYHYQGVHREKGNYRELSKKIYRKINKKIKPYDHEYNIAVAVSERTSDNAAHTVKIR